MQSALKTCRKCQKLKYPHEFNTSQNMCRCCAKAGRKPTELEILRKNGMLGCESWRIR